MKKAFYSLLCLSLLAACDSGGNRRAITERGEMDTRILMRIANPSSEDRFAFASQGMGGGMQQPQQQKSAVDDLSFHFDTPPGWVEVPTTQYRQVNFIIDNNPDAECYLSILPNRGGGVEANINRWRGQMGLGPLSADEIAALERKPLLNQPATFMVCEGSFGGMGGESKPDFLMAGLILEIEGFSIFVKMTGPKAVVSGHLEGFDTFASTLHLTEPGQEHNHDAPQAHSADDGHDHSAPAGAQGQAVDVSKLTWNAPADWVQGPDRDMRLVTYTTGEVECYVTVLGGDGGGVEMNINRWRGQMGQTPLSATEIAALPTLKMLGRKCPVVAIRGAYSGMDGTPQDGYMMMGVSCILPGNALFVKMVGPEAAVTAQLSSFGAFCESMQEATTSGENGNG